MLAEFSTPEAMVAAAHGALSYGGELVEAFTPFAVDGLDEVLPPRDAGIRLGMLLSGLLVAGAAYGFQWWTVACSYPFDSGGRPLNSWPVFMMFPFEIGLLAATIAGVVLLCLRGGLPALHAPAFEVDLLRRAEASGFFLALREPRDEETRNDLRTRLLDLGAKATREAEI